MQEAIDKLWKDTKKIIGIIAGAAGICLALGGVGPGGVAGGTAAARGAAVAGGAVVATAAAVVAACLR